MKLEGKIPKYCTHSIYHCSDGIDTVNCWKYLNEQFKECPYKKCEFFKEKMYD